MHEAAATALQHNHNNNNINKHTYLSGDMHRTAHTRTQTLTDLDSVCASQRARVRSIWGCHCLVIWLAAIASCSVPRHGARMYMATESWERIRCDCTANGWHVGGIRGIQMWPRIAYREWLLPNPRWSIRTPEIACGVL